MNKTLLAVAALSMLGATVAATPALAGDRDRVSRGEIRRDRQDVREERREYRQALRYGDRRDIREERREYRDAKRELRQDRRDLQRSYGYRGNAYPGGYYAAPAYYGGSPYYAGYRGDRRAASNGWYGRNGRYYGNDYNSCRRDSDTNGTVLGAIAGGVLGNSVGGGFGRAAATGLGVVTGSVIGNQVEADSNPVTTVPVRRCQTATSYESRVVGYDVTYDYAGQRYSTRMARDPGQRLAVSAQPLEASGGLPAPVYSAPVPPAAQDEVAAPVYATAPASPVYYYQPLPPPVYYAPAPYSYYGTAPAISLGIGYYGGYRGGRHWR